MAGKTVTITRTINAPIERVWRAWTNPDDLMHWFTAKGGAETKVIQFDVKVGGRVRLKFPGAAGEYTWTYVKIFEPRVLVFDILDFSLPQFADQGVGGICNVNFQDLGDKTEVTVSGELPDEMDNESMRKMAIDGWNGTIDKLVKFLSKEAKNGRN
jgi:uncharacterized protein YndB with AHSA1/START domain